jgi:hypothetical protein
MATDPKQEPVRTKPLKVHEDTYERFSRICDDLGISHNTYLRYLLDLGAGTRIGDLIDTEDGSLLCRYRIYIHQPIEADGTIRRITGRRPEGDVPPADQDLTGS